MLTFASKPAKAEIRRYWRTGEQTYRRLLAKGSVADGWRPDPCLAIDCAVREAYTVLGGSPGFAARRAIGFPDGFSAIVSHCASSMDIERGIWWARSLIEALPVGIDLRRTTAQYLASILLNYGCLALLPESRPARIVHRVADLLDRFATRGMSHADGIEARRLYIATSSLPFLGWDAAGRGPVTGNLARLAAVHAIRTIREDFETDAPMRCLQLSLCAATIADAPFAGQTAIAARLKAGNSTRASVGAKTLADARGQLRAAALTLLCDFVTPPGAAVPEMPRKFLKTFAVED